MLEFVTLCSLCVAVVSAFAAGWLWFESCYWQMETGRKEAELLRVQTDLADAKDERDQWERECICHEVETL